MGDASYLIYILRAPVVELAIKIAVAISFTSPWLTYEKALTAVPLLISVSVLVYHRFESPARSWICTRWSSPGVAVGSPG